MPAQVLVQIDGLSLILSALLAPQTIGMLNESKGSLLLQAEQRPE